MLKRIITICGTGCGFLIVLACTPTKVVIPQEILPPPGLTATVVVTPTAVPTAVPVPEEQPIAAAPKSTPRHRMHARQNDAGRTVASKAARPPAAETGARQAESAASAPTQAQASEVLATPIPDTVLPKPDNISQSGSKAGWMWLILALLLVAIGVVINAMRRKPERKSAPLQKPQPWQRAAAPEPRLVSREPEMPVQTPVENKIFREAAEEKPMVAKPEAVAAPVLKRVRKNAARTEKKAVVKKAAKTVTKKKIIKASAVKKAVAAKTKVMKKAALKTTGAKAKIIRLKDRPEFAKQNKRIARITKKAGKSSGA